MSKTAPITDKEFIEDPNLWPYWPLLPMKRHNGVDFQCGLVLQNRPTVVLLGVNIYASDRAELLERAPRQSYASIDDMLADGWQID